MKPKSSFLWILAILLTFSIAYYQRVTGPTKPVTGKIKMENKDIKFKLLRTETTGKDAEIKFLTENVNIGGTIKYKRFKSNDEWTEEPMTYKDGYLIGLLPSQPPAGKIIYEVTLNTNGNSYPLTEEPVIIRFKGDVPSIYLIPHIIFMVIVLLMAIRSGIQSIFVKEPSTVFTNITFFALILGGCVFGPIVQKYAFGFYWTGFPFGHDFTDNKTAIAVLFWTIAAFMAWRKSKNTRWWVLAAAIVLLATYLVPHSVLGSEIDYTKQPKVESNI